MSVHLYSLKCILLEVNDVLRHFAVQTYHFLQFQLHLPTHPSPPDHLTQTLLHAFLTPNFPVKEICEMKMEPKLVTAVESQCKTKIGE